MVYLPSEDSYLLEKEVKSYISNLKDKNIQVLDMGSGSGIQALTCIEYRIKKENILCADIDDKSIDLLKSKRLNAVKSDLFSNIPKINKKSKFDLIIFNPPYLPEDKYDNKANKVETTAGKKGYETIIKFLKQAKSHLNKGGTILLLISSLSKPEIIKQEVRKLGYSINKLAEEKLFFEKLEVWKLNVRFITTILL